MERKSLKRQLEDAKNDIRVLRRMLALATANMDPGCLSLMMHKAAKSTPQGAEE